MRHMMADLAARLTDRTRAYRGHVILVHPLPQSMVIEVRADNDPTVVRVSSHPERTDVLRIDTLRFGREVGFAPSVPATFIDGVVDDPTMDALVDAVLDELGI